MRLGYNPNKDQPQEKSLYNHQVVIPVYKRYQQEYFSGGLYILFKNNEL
jgi:hypothetical protein